ncbi:uncharacterized protein LOC120354036 isoform X1 [Nilaparvata lugens]|uniref:uncharacterized protein LOC120354036 isoform X1 n=1 Tax=Nilaparvata lugens TaxID=108931 RepID=UPI00193D5240|nr:uncharacterized protein LOC120354036 isoform X1 [Nilaparvata lugens]
MILIQFVVLQESRGKRMLEMAFNFDINVMETDDDLLLIAAEETVTALQSINDQGAQTFPDNGEDFSMLSDNYNLKGDVSEENTIHQHPDHETVPDTNQDADTFPEIAEDIPMTSDNYSLNAVVSEENTIHQHPDHETVPDTNQDADTFPEIAEDIPMTSDNYSLNAVVSEENIIHQHPDHETVPDTNQDADTFQKLQKIFS